jgi:hypothetical protein
MTTRPVGRDRHRSPRSLRRWLLGNGFLLVLPVLVWDVLLTAKLPAAYQRLGFVKRSGSAKGGSSTFAITASGTRRLRELLGKAVQAVPARNGLLLRLFFGRTLGVAACRVLITAAKADAQQRLLHFDDLAAQIAGEPQYADDAPSGN